MSGLKSFPTPPGQAEREGPLSSHFPSFAELLRRYRRSAGLTQEELAERATISTRAVSDIERGINQRPQRETVRLLADALGIAEPDRTPFESAARRSKRPAPALSPVTRAPTNLPVRLLPLIGRDADVASVCALLRREEVRLLTVTGPGGVGKTRLALEIGAALRDEFPDGVYFVPLAGIRDPALVPSAIAQVLGVQEGAGQALRDTLHDHLRRKRLLLVPDNFEHVLPAVPAVAALLAAAPKLGILVTSRAALHLYAEHEYVVEPLAVPDSRGAADLAIVARSAAIQLFVQRARAITKTFALTADNAGAIAEICRQLDGLPLAIELATARVRILSPEALRTRLERRLPLLTGGARDLPARQQTMRNAIAWSHDLLDDREQRLFRNLAVFVGGCTLAAIEAVCGMDDVPGDGLDGIQSLAEKSLVRTDAQADGTSRVAMLETIREYAGELLEASGDATAMRDRHARFFRDLAEAAEPSLVGPEQRPWSIRLEAEHDNLRAAMAWARAQGEAGIGLRIAGALWRFWLTHGFLTEGRTWLEVFLTSTIDAERRRLASSWAKALLGAAILATEQGDYARATALAEGSLPLLEEMGERATTAGLLRVLGNVARYQGAYGRALARYEESRALSAQLKDRHGLALTLNNMGTVARAQGDHAHAMSLFAESLAIKRALGDTRGVGITLFNMGDVARDQGEHERATALITESGDLFRQLGDKPGLAYALNNLGEVARDRRDLARAAALYEESLGLFRQLGDQASIALLLKNRGDVARLSDDSARADALYRHALTLYRKVGNTLGTIECIEGVAVIAQGRGEHTDAARFLGAAARERERIGAPLALAERPTVEDAIAAARDALGEEPFSGWWDIGRGLTLDELSGEVAGAAPSEWDGSM